MELTDDIMYQALLEKDTRFEGLFFTAVKSTGIFCRPSCTARKPKKENVEFFHSVEICMSKGYRPCKICKPLENLNETPAYIRQLIDELAENPSRKIKDIDLVQRGVEPHQIRRWFLKNHGITFHAYQRMFRINTAFKQIQQGSTVTDTAFSSGFESLSGFGDRFKSVFGLSPNNSRKIKIIDLKRIETKLGTMIACAVEEGVCLLEFTDRKMLETELKALAKSMEATIVQGENKHFPMLETQLEEYFEGERRTFDIPLCLTGTKFQQEVWRTLQTIPYGKTRTYKEQALALQKPLGVRAVAMANGMNKLAIVIPCHRVIGSGGQLTGYGGGLWRKQFLLQLESSQAVIAF
ncbi:bifunctional transcriptional activator/DNA repair protein Ada [Olivibacter sp. SDN3]|uniref:bifunctional transcriptional activator/DNA repair enzyme AdaA n=1 Tax=Olivibacter sp. SDN3 TaxID=2764720 RepID=UPI00165152F8|nr:trifunctional transcriptional activator/DNA repair protein Ada/methylated-DNA--[protein]-cysteine S-methyltransferase [Olivibacter sp. SDN3]QNL48199.1 bifunctional transcriptional activator/DNA repair protein Ada [Olivibacter sp. SDN3]